MNRFPKDVYLPREVSEQTPFYRALVDAFRDVALVTREIQAPPICVVDLNGSAQSLTVSTTNVVHFLNSSANAIDTHKWWDNTNYRYVPKEAGYWQVNSTFTLRYSGTGLITAGNIDCRIRKNGSELRRNTIATEGNAVTQIRTVTMSSIVYLDGSADYLDFTIEYDSGTALDMPASSTRSGASIAFLGAPQVA